MLSASTPVAPSAGAKAPAVGTVKSFKVKAVVVVDVLAAFPAASYIEAASAGLISTVSTPLGVPVTVRFTRITVSPAATASPSVCVMPAIDTALAPPPFCVNVRAKSPAASAPVPPLVLYTPSLNVTST